MAYFNDKLYWVQKQYFQALAMKYFDWDKLKTTMKNGNAITKQKAILNATVLHPLSQKYPTTNAYKLSFLKSLMTVFENLGSDVCDELCSLIAELMANKETSQEDFSYKSYILPCGQAITLCESTQFMSQGTTGLNTWQAGLHLSDWLIQNSCLLQGKKILELGCGVGLTGLVALHCCRPKSYIFTDCHDKVLQKVKENLQINGFCSTDQTFEQCQGRNHEQNLCTFTSKIEDDDKERFFEERLIVSDEFPTFSSSQSLKDCRTCSSRDTSVVRAQCSAVVCQLDWERCAFNEIERHCPDIILASDVVFDPRLIEPLVKVIKALLCYKDLNSQPVAYIASTIRNQETYEKFLHTLAAPFDFDLHWFVFIAPWFPDKLEMNFRISNRSSEFASELQNVIINFPAHLPISKIISLLNPCITMRTVNLEAFLLMAVERGILKSLDKERIIDVFAKTSMELSKALL